MDSVKAWLKSPQVFVYLLLLIIASLLFGFAAEFKASMSEGLFQLLMAIGISIVPASLLAILFRFFLLDDVRTELLLPLRDLEEKTVSAIETRLQDSFRPILAKVALLTQLEDLGLTYVYRTRAAALQAESGFYRNLSEEKKEIMIVGSSLRGLLLEPAYQAVREMLLKKVDIIKFLLTHPCVADLRAGQENRPRGAIPAEVIASLEVLKDHQVQPDAVKLYTGTPTCFAIKTSTRMLINPYPYAKQAMDSPCFELEARHPIYEVFSTAHFGAFNMEFAEGFADIDAMIEKLKRETPEYSNKVECVLNHISPTHCTLR